MHYDVHKLVENASDFTCKPQVVTTVENLLFDPTTAFSDVAKVISMDPALAARTFKVANSCFFGRMTKAKTLTEAIVTIGTKGLYSLVLVHTIIQAYKSFGLQERSFWNHAVGVSIASMTLAAENAFRATEDAMVCGLLHDIGKGLMNGADPDHYATVTKKVYNERVPYSCAEQELFGFTHSDVGYLLAQKWNLPAYVQTVILYHHDPESVEKEDTELLRLTSTVNLADMMCIKLGMSVQEFDNGFSWNDVEAAKALEFSEERLDELEPIIRARINEEKMMFE